MASPFGKRSRHLPAIRYGVWFRLILLIAGLSSLTSMAAASTIVGKVMNRSRNQPSSGDEVVLYRVDQTMHEVDRTKSDEHGTFRFNDSGGSHYLVAVSHQRISYHTGLISGTETITVAVYDTVPKLDRMQELSNTLFPQADRDLLRVTEFFVVSNESNPPRTLSAKQTFSFLLPQGQGAVLDSTAVQPPGTLPSLLRASACGARDQYCIAYPMRPGSTKIRVLYHLPYAGNISITQPLLHPVGEVALVVPESLHFEASYPGVFWNRGTQNGSSRYVAANLRSGQSLTFSLSGANAALRQTPAKTATLNTAGLPQPVPQPALLSPAKHVPSLTILIGALLGAGFIVTLAFRRAVRASV